jgi:glycine/D-amino acid oxidase-like deaminating enzyme
MLLNLQQVTCRPAGSSPLTISRVTGLLPLWHDDPYEERAPLASDHEADVLVIGAGIAGLSCAWHLAERGVDCTVVEARTAAGGASGRNGGFLVAGAAPAHQDAVREFGHEVATGIYRATLASQQRVYEIAGEIGASDHFAHVGCLRVTWDADEVEHARVQYEAMCADGLPAEWVEEADLPPIVRQPGRAGVFSAPDATMHPARWVRAFSRACEERGVRIFEHSPVPEPLTPAAAGGFAVRAGGGTVHARRVVVAADGALPQLVPYYAPCVRTKRLHMVATAPIAERVVPCAIGARWGYEYLQQRPDGRIAAGGFSDCDGEGAADSYTTAEAPSGEIHARIERFLRDDLGVDAPVTHRWVGLVGYSRDQRPFAGAVPEQEGLYVAGGYNGTGNLNGFTAGRIVSELLATGSSADAYLYDSARPLRTS